ncbi:Calponin-2, partial [Camelus dromedarius]
ISKQRNAGLKVNEQLGTTTNEPTMQKANSGGSPVRPRPVRELEPDKVQVSLLALAGKAKTKGLQSGVDIVVKYSEKQERNFDDATMKAGQCVIGLQMGTNKCASQANLVRISTVLRLMPLYFAARDYGI